MVEPYTLRQFAKHLFLSKRWDSFHSPYLFELFTYCCDEKVVVEKWKQIETYRTQWQQSGEMIDRMDLGAGSKHVANGKTALRSIARHALSKPFQCRFMSRLASFHQPGFILELGTSLGISAAYLASGAPSAHIDTVEGDPAIAAKANLLFTALQFSSIQQHAVSFEDYFKESQVQREAIDLIFIDGDHTAKALQTYFEQVYHRCHPKTIVVVDDIYWSADMTRGWEDLTRLPGVTQSIDCFHFGILFFNQGFLNKETHKVRLPMGMLIR